MSGGIPSPRGYQMAHPSSFRRRAGIRRHAHRELADLAALPLKRRAADSRSILLHVSLLTSLSDCTELRTDSGFCIPPMLRAGSNARQRKGSAGTSGPSRCFKQVLKLFRLGNMSAVLEHALLT